MTMNIAAPRMIPATATEARQWVYYVLRGRYGGKYYSHQVGGTTHTVRDWTAIQSGIWTTHEEATAAMYAAGSAAWEVAEVVSPSIIPITVE